MVWLSRLGLKKWVINCAFINFVSYWILQTNCLAIHGGLCAISLPPVYSLVRWSVYPCVLYMTVSLPFKVVYWPTIITVDIVPSFMCNSLVVALFVCVVYLKKGYLRLYHDRSVNGFCLQVCMVGLLSWSLAPYERACKRDWLFADIWFLCEFLGFGWVSKRYWFYVLSTKF